MGGKKSSVTPPRTPSPLVFWKLSYTGAAASCERERDRQGWQDEQVSRQERVWELADQKLIKSSGRDTTHLYQLESTCSRRRGRVKTRPLAGEGLRIHWEQVPGSQWEI